MTETQKKQIKELRLHGLSYGEIGEKVDLPQGTVKSFCWRNRIENIKPSKKSVEAVCLNCGQDLKQNADAPPRKFCSDKCRSVWWVKNRKPNNTAVCSCCQKEFAYYGRADRKYCSHKCFIKDRFGEGLYDE